MNYMSEVAKMLGVELNERFSVIDNDGKKIVPNYYITLNGIFAYTTPPARNMEILSKILYGEYTIKRKPWKPEENEDFWFVDVDGGACRYSCFNSYDEDYVNYYKLGNCYRTKKEAEANSVKWKAFYASDEVLEV